MKESDFIFYRDNNKNIQVRLILGDETVWSTQRGMAEIFGVEIPAISKHVNNIYDEGELEKDRTISKMEIVQKEGNRDVSRNIDFYNLDVIIAVGYRVNSFKATQFRIWATSILKEYMIKGFVLDEDRLKQGTAAFGKDYFNELLERIREIRASERRFYQKITDLYAQASIDYDSDSTVTHEFYAFVQNKLHYAVTDQTAAEIVKSRASASKSNMGLTTWKNAPDGKILKTDVSVAKNYLTQDEISELNIIVNMYLDYAELQAKKMVPMKMVDWIGKLDAFLKFNDYGILTDAGHISAKLAKDTAEKEYEKYRVIQDKEYKSDFDKVIEQVKTTGKLPENKTSGTSELSDETKKSEFDQILGAIMKVPKPKK